MTEGKVVISCALTCGFHGKEANLNIPEHLGEIVTQGTDARRAGAAILYVDVHNPSGSVTMNKEICQQTHAALCAETDAVIQLATGDSQMLSIKERLNTISLDPEICSLNMDLACISSGPRQACVDTYRSDLERLVHEMQRRGIRPEMKATSLAMLVVVNHLIDAGLLEPPYVVNLTLHTPIPGGAPGAFQSLVEMMSFLPSHTIFNVSATGRTHLSITTMAMAMGLNVRIGMEGTVYYRKGELAKHNAQLISRIVRIAHELELEPATPEEARQFLKLRGREADQLPERLITEQTHDQ